MVNYLIIDWKLSTKQACEALSLARSMYYYEYKDKLDKEIINKLNELVEVHPTYGFWKLYGMIRNQGYQWNAKRKS